MRWCKTVCVGTLVLAGAAGCGSEPPPAQDLSSASVPAASSTEDASTPVASAGAPSPAGLDENGLRAQAERAVAEQRIHSPAGASAVDYYLALRERAPDAAGVDAALIELQPYVLIAAEQALARADREEARRLLDLLARVDASAPALPRLRQDLRVADENTAKAESAQRPDAARTADVSAQRPAPGLRASTAIAASAVAEPVKPPAAPVSKPSPLPASSPPVPTLAASAASAREPIPASASAPDSMAADAMPRLISDAPPRYPLAARNRRIEGSVRIAFTIQPDGRVSDLRLLSAQPEGVFDEAALVAAARWRFEASGRRVTSTRTLTFRLPPG